MDPDEIKKILRNVFLSLGVITVSLYLYTRVDLSSFIGLEERFLAVTLLFGFLNIIFYIKEISTWFSKFRNNLNFKTNVFVSKKKINFSQTLRVPRVTGTDISYVVYLLLIIAVSFTMIFFSSKFLLQLGDLIPYFILIYFFISLLLKLDSRFPIAFALFLLFLTAIILVQGFENAANQVAIYAYYFLVIGVVLQLIEYIRNPEKEY